jgi:MFS family permease
MGFGALTTAVAPSVWVALPCMVLGGAGNGAAVVYNSLLVQRGAPDELRGRVFTVIMSTNFAVLGLGMVIAGPLTDAVGARWVFAISAICAGLGALVGFFLLRSASAQTTEPDVATAIGARWRARSPSSRTAIPSPPMSSTISIGRPGGRERSASRARPV